MRGWGKIAVLAVVVGASCKPPETPKHPEYVEQMCRAECDRAKACGAAGETSQCFKECMLSGSPRRAYDRDDYVRAVLACFADAPCTLEDGKAVAVERCRGKVFRATQPSPAAVEHCRRSATRYDECGYIRPYDECIDGTKLYRDDVLRELDECLTHDCRRIGGCVREVVGEDEAVPKLKKK